MRTLYKSIKNCDKVLLILTILLISYGLLNIVTASSRQAVTQDVPLYYYFYQQSKMILIGLFISLFIFCVDTKKYKHFMWLLYGGILFFLILLLMSGSSHRGSINWLSIAGIKFQPSEFAKPVLIASLAVLLERLYALFRKKDISHIPFIMIVLIVGMLFPLIVIYQKDFGTGMILFGIFGTLFLASPILRIEKFWTIVIAIIIGIIGILAVLATGHELLTEEQKSRFDFYNPCSNYEDGGYQICNGFIAIHDGGLFGLGIGKSKQKYSYIPEPHTDSVFAIIAEEYGLIFCLGILFIFLIILYRILRISALSNTLRGRYIALGVAVYMFLHILINLGGLFGIMPLTGVPLPFLSYGGSFTISLICSIAMAQRVYIEMKIQKKEKK